MTPPLEPQRKGRTFQTGAYRDSDNNKIDPEGFISPIVIQAYCEYMKNHRIQSNGELRDSDNWQKGIPKGVYMKSLLRHTIDLWLIHRGFPDKARESIKDALCAIMFNSMGYLHEILKEENNKHNNNNKKEVKPISLEESLGINKNV